MDWGSETLWWILALVLGLMLLLASWLSCRSRSAICRSSRDHGLVESLGDALIATDDCGTILRFNALAEKLTGVSREAPGRSLHIAESRSRWEDDRGREIGWVILFRDITEDYRLRRELRESEARFQDFADTAADLYWEMDAQLRFTRVSGKVRFLMGHEPEFVLGKTRLALGGRQHALCLDQWTPVVR